MPKRTKISIIFILNTFRLVLYLRIWEEGGGVILTSLSCAAEMARKRIPVDVSRLMNKGKEEQFFEASF